MDDYVPKINYRLETCIAAFIGLRKAEKRVEERKVILENALNGLPVTDLAEYVRRTEEFNQ